MAEDSKKYRKSELQITAMSHEYFNQRSGDMLCYFFDHNTRNYLKKIAFSDVVARY